MSTSAACPQVKRSYPKSAVAVSRLTSHRKPGVCHLKLRLMPDPNAGYSFNDPPSFFAKMSRDSQASFSTSILASIHQEYGYHCSICLNFLTRKGSQLIDSGTIGAKQV